MTQDCMLHGEQTLDADGTLRLFQITDTHLMAERGGRLLNVDTDESLLAVVELAHSTGDAPHGLLITGDIAGDAAPDAYHRLEAAIAGFNAPSFWLPGNHDGCSEANVAAEHFSRTILTPHWHIVMLNSQVDGEVGGRLAAMELEALALAVDAANATQRHLLVALHHPLHALGCAWLDPQRVDNADAFFAEVGRCKTGVLVVSGHVHQESDHTVNGVRYLTTPSTCVQFAPGQEDFTADTVGPGFRWLELHPDGTVNTAVERVTDRAFPVDLDSNGYL